MNTKQKYWIKDLTDKQVIHAPTLGIAEKFGVDADSIEIVT